MSDQTPNISAMNRRKFLMLGGASAATLAIAGMLPGLSLASVEGVEARIKELTEGKSIKEGKITFKLPTIAENGNTVPVTINVDSPMTDDDHVTSVYLLSEKNPVADIAAFHLTPMSGKAMVSTRVRLAKTQNLIAVAQMSDGSVYIGKKKIKVTIGGCGG